MLNLCPTLCNPMGCIPPCSSVFRVLQARILEWVIVSFSGVLYHAMLCMLSHFSCVQLFATLWTIACQAPLSMGLSRQEHWSGLLYPPLGDLPNPGIEPASLMSPALVGRFFTTSATWATAVLSLLLLLLLSHFSHVRLCATP